MVNFYTFTLDSGPNFYTFIFFLRALRARLSCRHLTCTEWKAGTPSGSAPTAHRTGNPASVQLKEELEGRGEGKSGNKAWLRRRLHAAIVSDHLQSEHNQEP